MPKWLQATSLEFPPLATATEDGLLAFGGDLRPERLLASYARGIFPWYSPGSPILWWCPDPRFVLWPADLRVSKSTAQLIRNQRFKVTVNRDFRAVIAACQKTPRPGQNGTWLTPEMVEAYATLHAQGYAHSVEVWQADQLVGGLYGLILGRCFFGESMFAHVSNASKVGFITLVRHLEAQGFKLIDCQVYTEHLASLGATMMPREAFLAILAANGTAKFELSASFGKEHA
ncbi:MAG: leucyl/phenylalanyl-tRNA--protein transferase [Bernardetiaceae bacterium]|jgi:leucyl/phenylalanyl-tRNA--protein transferase|nr:leucyl/phenylalanyl-tRNA--protein transferase [Bernardetiaceae bacterium]